MRFHIDTRSAAQEDRGSQFDFRNTINAAGSFGFGPWGVSASMTNTIGYVSTEKTQSTEEMNTELDLNSSVELVFKTDYLPLERMAGQGQIDRIKVNTLNPDAEAKLRPRRAVRAKRYAESEKERRASVDKSIGAPPATPTSPRPGEAGSVEAAEKARKDATRKRDDGPVSRRRRRQAEAMARADTMAPGRHDGSCPTEGADAGHGWRRPNTRRHATRCLRRARWQRRLPSSVSLSEGRQSDSTHFANPTWSSFRLPTKPWTRCWSWPASGEETSFTI